MRSQENCLKNDSLRDATGVEKGASGRLWQDTLARLALLTLRAGALELRIFRHRVVAAALASPPEASYAGFHRTELVAQSAVGAADDRL
jgi:hypothetical protein